MTLDTTALEHKWRGFMLAAGRHAIRDAIRCKDRDALEGGEQRYYRRDVAADAIESRLFDSLEWEHVPATEISDFAAELADEAEREVWEEESDA